MNLAAIEVSIYDRLNLGNNPDSSVARMLRQFINDSHRETITKKWCSLLRRRLLTFQTVAGSPFAVLPQAAVKMFLLTDRTNNNILDEISLQQIRYNDPGLLSSTSSPYAFAIYDYSAGTSADPSAVGTLSAVSDNAKDGTGITVYVEGATSDGQAYKFATAMNGLTPVTFNVATWQEVYKFYLSAPAQGHVLLKDQAGNTISSISPGRQYARYTRIHLYPNCSAQLTMTADVEVHVEPMSYGGDEPIIPEDFHDILFHGCLSKEYMRRGDTTKAGTEMTIYRQRIAELQAFLARPSGTPRNQQRPRRFSQLGANFPSGT